MVPEGIYAAAATAGRFARVSRLVLLTDLRQFVWTTELSRRRRAGYF